MVPAGKSCCFVAGERTDLLGPGPWNRHRWGSNNRSSIPYLYYTERTLGLKTPRMDTQLSQVERLFQMAAGHRSRSTSSIGTSQ